MKTFMAENSAAIAHANNCTVNDLEVRAAGNWGAEEWRKPEVKWGDAEVFSEHGRILNNTDYRSHWFVIGKNTSELSCALYVKHGGGEERVALGYTSGINAIKTLALLDNNSRYIMMHLLYRIHTEARRNAADDTAQIYRKAFAEGKLKKRKVRGSSSVKVWIEQ